MTDSDGNRSRTWWMIAAGSLAVLCGLTVAFFLVRPQFGDDGGLPAAIPVSDRASSTEPRDTEPATTDPPPSTDDAAPSAAATTLVDERDDEEEDPGAATTTVPDDDTDPPATAAVVPSAGDANSTQPSTTAPRAIAPEPEVADAPAPDAPSYPTLDDGTPVPIVVIFDGTTIALSGVAPSIEASDRLETLAIANSAVPNASVVNFMTINPDVPISVGVRVIEMQSPRFGENSAEIVPDHAMQLSRAVAVMKALPNISCVVIGHADQRGDPTRNYEISADRAASVVDYMASQGIDPARLSSRAVGETDLLTLNNDDVAFELNRRTEFIFYGLLIE